MKKLSRFWLAGLLLLGVCACSDDGLPGDNGKNEGVADAVYMQFKVGLPGISGSRSETASDGDDKYGESSDGVEIGKDGENKVSEVLIVITDTSDKYITHSSAYSPASTENGQTYVVPFESSDLAGQVGKNVKVYVYCNPAGALKTAVTGGTFDLNAKYALTANTDVTPWTTGQFFMSNADTDFTRPMPASLDAYKVESNPWKLGIINVERSAARFDYKSNGVADANGKATDIYTVTEDETGKAQVQVQLTEMALINLSKEFHYLRRVSDDGKSTGANFTICGTEYDYVPSGSTTAKANYVVDTDATWKEAYTSNVADKADHFYYSSDDAITSLAWQTLPLGSTEDNDNTWNNDHKDDGYRIWRYATENTIPAAVSNQKHGITTGVVFKGEIKVADGWTSDLATTITTGTADLYVFGNVLYGTWANVKTAAEAADGTSGALVNPALNVAYNAVAEQAKTESLTEETDAFREAAAAKNFTVYSPNSENKYEVLYYYWNRHNDNGNNGVMGPMEFAVVRNNVYKLSVTEINKLGHPVLGADPEDPKNPDDPDESDNVYFEVAVKVLPWVVRINNIIF